MQLIERTKHDIYPFISPESGLKDSAKGKTVLVTGGGKGIGKAIATQFALAGATTVIISGRSRDALEAAKSVIEADAPHCAVVPIVTDVTDQRSVQSLFDGLSSPPDVLVNNAGGTQASTAIVDSVVDDWWMDFETNAKSVYMCSRAYLRALAGRPGVILNVSSNASFSMGRTLSSYSASKTAANRITEFIDLEHSEQGVQCIAFHPGGIADTDLGRRAPAAFQPYLNDTANLAAGTAVFLSTPRAAFLRGRFVLSNWDMEKLESQQDRILTL
ncbi:MAG: hypothetical protein M1838_002748 [Thelocarpon superellum]|nr:MAG: hypothetical protein M1838_002748 [Thelocarpon superellum]